MAPSERLHEPARGEWLAACGLSLFAAALVFLVAPHLTGQPAFQTRANLAFAQRGSFLEALLRYHQWPPLYPWLLWVTARARVPALGVDAALVGASCLLFWRVARRGCAPRTALAALGAYGIAHFNVDNAARHMSEPLAICLELGVVLALLSYRALPDRARLAVVGALLGAACLTRYHALFWLAPCAIAVAWRGGGGRPRSRHAAALAFMAVAPVAAWMAKEKLVTGFLSGTGRLHERRNHELTTLGMNAWFTVKTFAVDWFSPAGSASHQVINAPWRPTPLEVALVVAGFAGLAGALAAVVRRRSAAPGAAPGLEGLNGALLGLYLASVLALWTVGNNDPIYTRFLYPSYPFVALAIAIGWPAAGRIGRVPFRIVTAAYLIAQASKYAALVLRA